MREKEIAKAFLLAHAPLSFATRAANLCWYSAGIRDNHFPICDEVVKSPSMGAMTTF